MNTNQNVAYSVREAAFELGALRQVAKAMITNQESFIDWGSFANMVIATTISATVRLDACSRALTENGEDSSELEEYMDVNWPLAPEEKSPAGSAQEGGAT